MNFSWWLTIILHSFILILNWIIKKPIHFIITLIVFWFFIGWFTFLSRTSFIDNNISHLKNYHACFKRVDIDENKKYIILRLDDIQSSSLRDITFKMLNEGFNRKIPFTLGVIPLNIENDKLMTTYLNNNRCYIEIAQHWFNHRNDIPEFQNLPELLVENKLEQWLKILNKLTDKDIVTFIPPENIYSTGTSIWARKKWFKIISSEGKGFFDYSASTFNYDTLKLNTISSIINKSNIDANNKWFSIIMLHPQDYVDENWRIDDNKYREYIKLLDYLEEQWFWFTTMYDYYNHLDRKWKALKFYDLKANSNTYTGIEIKGNDHILNINTKKEEIKLISN